MILFLPVKEARAVMPKRLRRGLDRIYNWQDATPRTWCLLCRPGDSKTVAAVIQFELHGGLLHEMGTVVSPGYRRNGLASNLWEMLLEATGAVEVKATLVSSNGDRLAEAVRRQFPWIDWTLSVKRGDL